MKKNIPNSNNTNMRDEYDFSGGVESVNKALRSLIT